MKSLLFLIGGILIGLITYSYRPVEDSIIEDQYYFEILDEHEIRCVNGNDTVTLLFENAYALGGQNNVVSIIK